MATRTSVGSGLWSSAGTWDTGVPVDGDDVVIASGHIVTFDVNQSAFVTGVKVTITGTLTHTTAAGSYCLFLKTGASVVGAGTWNIGTSGAPIPFASKHTITGAADTGKRAKYPEEYDIFEEKNGYGRIGASRWISLAYTERVTVEPILSLEQRVTALEKAVFGG